MKGYERRDRSGSSFDEVLRDMELREVIVNDMFDLRDEIQDVIDPAKEFSRDMALLWELSARLANVMVFEDEDIDEVRKVIYRGVQFALQVVDELKTVPIRGLPIGDFFRSIDSTSPAQTIADLTTDYLNHNSAIGSLIRSFETEIDVSYEYYHHAKSSAALTFLLCERQHELIMTVDEIDAHLP